MENHFKIVILASGEGSNARNLLESAKSHDGWEVMGVLCDNPAAKVLKEGENWGVPVCSVPFTRTGFSSFSSAKRDFERRLLSKIISLEGNLICLAGFMRILSKEFLCHFFDKNWQTNRVINLHPSLLPMFSGKDAYERIFEKNVLSTGISLHFVDEKIDTGPVILQESFTRKESASLQDFIKQGKKIEHRLYPKALALLLEEKQQKAIRVLVERPGEDKIFSFYTIKSSFLPAFELRSQMEKRGHMALCDQVLEKIHLSQNNFSLTRHPTFVVEVSYRPGVTDNTALAMEEALTLLNFKVQAASGKLYFVYESLTKEEVFKMASSQWGNNLIHNICVSSWEEFCLDDFFNNPYFPQVEITGDSVVESISLKIADSALEELSKKRHLALDLWEMKHIRQYFASLKKDPTDVELEMIAQTWSEHCKHKIFNGQIDYKEENLPENQLPLGNERIDGLFKKFIKGATEKIIKKRGITWGISLFEDNAGIVRFDENIDLAIKVETHNAPSALDPYGGSLTGILGVNRDILGSHLGAKPVANLDVFCLAPPSWPDKKQTGLAPAGIPLPQNLLAGVHKGVEDGGNRSGIPTVTGAFYFDEDYAGRPLVFCGTVGVLPGGASFRPKKASPGHRIVMVGGAVGADGIHGATFSSMGLDENAPATAVQIGNPLMQKRMQDFLLEARDEGLYSSVTDNGAGGLSSSVGEMALQTGGACLDLSLCPVKYPGLKPFELMISESQERMTLAVAPQKLNFLLALAKKRGVSATDLGSFDESGYLTVKYKDSMVGQLSLNFLHEPPDLKLFAHYNGPKKRQEWGFVPEKKIFEKELGKKDFFKNALYTLLQSPSISSKEEWTRRYDHQVQAATHLGAFSGKGDGPGDGAVIWTFPHGGKKDNAFCLGLGLAAESSLFDPYMMAQFSVDEAVRNAVVVGGDPKHCCLLDNFCWPDPVASMQNPDGPYKLGQLVRACRGLHDISIAYGTPLVSGKDSMKNDFSGKNRQGEPLSIHILPTLLVTAMAKANIFSTCSSDFKKAGDIIYLLGKNTEGLAASALARHYHLREQQLPSIDIPLNKKLYNLYHHALQKKIILSGHDISEGGLLVALTESMIAGGMGAMIDLPKKISMDNFKMSEFFFGESPGRFLVSVSPKKVDIFEEHFSQIPIMKLGKIHLEKKLMINAEKTICDIPLVFLEAAWRVPW